MNTIWTPQPKQFDFMCRPEDEALYGGAAGGGKSDALVIEATRQIHIPYYKGLILRKTFPQLEELIDKSLKYYPLAFPGAVYNSSKHTWNFPSGAKILFRSMPHHDDKNNFQGQAYDFIGFDELTHFTYDEYMYLKSRNRPNGPGTRCYIRATANPGGIGHGWVKERFITAAPPMTTIWEENIVAFPNGTKKKMKSSRIFVPSSVFDNQILLDNDPAYLAQLASMPEAEKKALLYGDWESYSGQFFTEFRNDPEHYDDRKFTHVINPFSIPNDWNIYRSFDWGYHRPFSCGWWAIDFDGTVYRIAELYGCNGTPNEGVEKVPEEVFDAIHKTEIEHPFLKGKNIGGVADPAIWDKERGISIEETARKYGIYFKKGDNSRIPGWMQMHYRMMFDKNGYPSMYIFKNCKDFIRTIPQLIYDEHKVEDLNTDGEDHIADETRYFLMSKPIQPKVPAKLDDFVNNPLHVFLNINREDLATPRVREHMIIEEVKK